ncbi:cobalt-precorrin-8X methylmutase [Waterburya agarophytonicola K14]|uniref:Cobalt-precorrin-8X methylmutase n=1 Tax=Waterburya agarophytonicola KI4 TaxID=2874699 RepID=A0A964FFC0_9CYAN|nr:cobalt-precorrin-8X methylmutase [Waterburya agarophytonicola]MCC0176802.1 cobalt-precorrin-8X methylmutase [Waterburya agarophytonicola KI4]
MKTALNHPIVEQSFAIIDREVGKHQLNQREYAISRRVIHATADFEYLNLLKFSPSAIDSGIAAIKSGVPIITDVTMVERGIKGLVAKTFNNPVIAAIDLAKTADPGKTRTETGLLKCCARYPEAIYVIGNAPTALLGLCDQISHGKAMPALVIGVPVGFVSVIESKQALLQLDIPQIVIEGRKGGSPAAASIVNALLVLASYRN